MVMTAVGKSESAIIQEGAESQNIDIRRIEEFPNHPFKVEDDQKMDALKDSIWKNGILTPVVLRPRGSGKYEMVSGHRRLHAAKALNLERIPAIVKEMEDDEATIYMVDSNIQREELLPSEKAFALKMKLDALSRQGQRTDLYEEESTSAQSERETASIIGKEFGISRAQVRRFIRLTYLLPELLEMVDLKKIGFVMAVDISYLNVSVQRSLYAYIQQNGVLKRHQVAALRQQGSSSMTQQRVFEILKSTYPKEKQSGAVLLSEKKLENYFPADFSVEEREEIILDLLQKWKDEK